LKNRAARNSHAPESETSFGVTQDRRILLVEAVVNGISGWGEVTTVESPSYNSETTDTAWHVISDFIAPRLVGKDLPAASDTPKLMASIRGHQMAKAGVENAIWDAEAQLKGVPLAKSLAASSRKSPAAYPWVFGRIRRRC
jgi:o-succinylbenzoate synthase